MGDYTQPLISDEFSRLAADLLDQSLAKIRHCTHQLVDPQIWWRPEPTLNSIGNLCLHLAGNLRQWGVAPFTLERDRRNRDSEFQHDTKMPAAQLLERLQKVVDEAKTQWQHLAPGQFLKHVDIQGFDVTHMQAIVHSSSHFVGHTHQIVQLTRLQLGTGYKFHWTPDEDRGDLPV